MASHFSALSATNVSVTLLDFRFSALRSSCLKSPITAFKHGAANDKKLRVPVIFWTRFVETLLDFEPSADHFSA